jgi:MATE family, multidrug efflux pump
MTRDPTAAPGPPSSTGTTSVAGPASHAAARGVVLPAHPELASATAAERPSAGRPAQASPARRGAPSSGRGGDGLDPRTARLLHGPIVPVLVRLAAPNVVVMVVQTAVNVLEAVFVGWLGRDALAGVALVFPLVMLMQTMSAGGMGGGVASAIARALGRGRSAQANALVVHALVIAGAFGIAFTLTLGLGGPALYRAMGGGGGVLAAALAYSNVIFAGSLAFWIFNTLGSIHRGTGNMVLPAGTVVGGAVVLLTLSPSLIFGWGPFPRLGVAGAGVAVVIYYVLGSVVLGAALLRGRGLVTLTLRGTRLRWPLFRDILRVGAPGALNTVQANLTVVVLTALVGRIGASAGASSATLAGYGMGARLEYLQIPLVFGLGSALVTMVGTAVGAGDVARARRVAYTGALMAFVLTETIGLAAAVRPDVWLGLFSGDPAVLAAGARYLRIVGPVYGFFGLGLALYFASQGAGHLLWPLIAGFARLLLAAAGGWLVVAWLGGGLTALYAVIACSFLLFGSTLLLAVRAAWTEPA